MSSFILQKAINFFFTNFTGQDRIKQTSYYQRQDNFHSNFSSSRYVNNMYDLFLYVFLTYLKEISVKNYYFSKRHW